VPAKKPRETNNLKGIKHLMAIVLIAFLTLLFFGCKNILVSMLPRPQEPKDRPYIIENVSFSGACDDVTLSGELTMPYEGGPFPAIILIAGSGPYDRDENISGHKVLLVLSDYLTRHGYAVLRYDKRGIGESSGDYKNATMKDFAADAATALRWLKRHNKIDGSRIGYMGHSSGGYVAPLAARKGDAAFLVLLAGPAEGIADIFIRQNEDIARAQKKNEEWIKLQQTMVHEFVNIHKSATVPDESYMRACAAYAKYQKNLGLPKNYMKDFLELVPSPWFLWALNYDPLPALEAYHGPVLALFGGKDLQVSAAHNAPIIDNVLTNKESKVIVFPDLNHLFQPAKTGLPEEYVQIDTTFDKTAMKAIVDWMGSLERLASNR
jgi:pimeloyl-ACP methyl ester carboxylesterase